MSGVNDPLKGKKEKGLRTMTKKSRHLSIHSKKERKRGKKHNGQGGGNGEGNLEEKA